MSPSLQKSADVTTNCLNIKCSKGGKPSHTRLHSILGKFSRACSHLHLHLHPRREQRPRCGAAGVKQKRIFYNQVEVRNSNLWHDQGVKFPHVQCPPSSCYELESVNNKGRRSRVGGGKGNVGGKQVIKMSSITWSSSPDTSGVLRVFSGCRALQRCMILIVYQLPQLPLTQVAAKQHSNSWGQQ